MTKQIYRFLESALADFAKWIEGGNWRGKERDCVNIFAMEYLIPRVSESTAIVNYGQIRIEGGVPQPKGFPRPSAAKDLVIWRNRLDVAWNEDWIPVKSPWVVMEWKTRRSGKHPSPFDAHDVKWLTGFTTQNPNSVGYAVTVDFCGSKRAVHIARFKAGNQTLLTKTTWV